MDTIGGQARVGEFDISSIECFVTAPAEILFRKVQMSVMFSFLTATGKAPDKSQIWTGKAHRCRKTGLKASRVRPILVKRILYSYDNRIFTNSESI